MLCQFSVSNFGCIKDEVTLDFQATSLTEHKESILSDVDGEVFLPLAVIYGPNGAGKSTILFSIHALISTIMRPVCAITSSCNKADECLKRNDVLLYSSPFRFSEKTKNMPTCFEIFFRTAKNEYQYNLHILKSKIIYEHLMKKNLSGSKYSQVFERKQSIIELNGSLRTYAIKDISDDITLLSYLAITHGRNAIIKDIREWLEDGVEVLNFGNPNRERKIYISDSPKTKKIVLDMFSEMDIDITDYRIVEDENGKIKNIYTKHIVQGNEYEIELSNESSGTIKLFSIIPEIVECLVNGSTLIIDELDAKLHPLLLKYIIQLFTNPNINRKKSQLVFTSQDISTMSLDIFRRDEIWFVAKSMEQSAKLYSLAEFKGARKDAVINKQYLEGRYGGDPYLKKIIDWSKEK